MLCVKFNRNYHDWMPVRLPDRDTDDWMDPRARGPLALKRLLVPAPADLLVATPVSPEVNNVDYDSPDLQHSNLFVDRAGCVPNRIIYGAGRVRIERRLNCSDPLQDARSDCLDLDVNQDEPVQGAAGGVVEAIQPSW
jgi:SOS response associated peptidase (SRAP)